MAGSKEDVETERAFFQDLRRPGLCDPMLVVSDGAPGIIRRSNAFRARRASAAWPTGSATSQPKFRLTLAGVLGSPPPSITTLA